jgi:hypothetical protein
LATNSIRAIKSLALCALFLTVLSCANGQASSTQYTLTMVRDSVFIDPPTPDSQSSKGTRIRHVDLNNDSREDLVVYLGNCGNWGDCVFAFFIAGKDQKYSLVFDDYLPVFEFAASTTKVGNVTWRDITILERSGDAGEKIISKKLFFNGTVYQLR